MHKKPAGNYQPRIQYEKRTGPGGKPRYKTLMKSDNKPLIPRQLVDLALRRHRSRNTHPGKRVVR